MGKIVAWWKSLARWVQILIGIIILVVIGAVIVLVRGNGTQSAATSLPVVSLQSINSFGDATSGVDVTGTVSSENEGDILAQAAGTVTAVNTSLGANVPAGFVIASLDSSSASAAVLQAQGAYDAALAASKATNLQAQNSTASLSQEQAAIQTLYQTDYASAQGAVTNDADPLFGQNTPLGPALVINPLTTGNQLPEERRSITVLLGNWQASLAAVNSTDSLTLLTNAQNYLNTINTFFIDLNNLATTQGSGASAAQLADVAAGEGIINNLLSGITSAQTAYNNAQTTAAVGQTQSTSGEGVTSSEASIEEALGGLRAAQAAYEKTQIIAPIAGTVNFLQIHVGDYINLNQHVATVARNNALQVVLELSQDDADRLAVGDTLPITDANGNTSNGIVTNIAPALDPTTEQIEVDVAVDENSSLVDGESVQVALPALPTDSSMTSTSSTGSAAGSTGATTSSSSTTASSTSSVEVPLTAVKLLPDERDVFTVDPTGHLVAHPVTIGNVIGDLIQITSPIDQSLLIVTDARGLSAGDAVTISTSTTPGTPTSATDSADSSTNP